MEAAGLLYLHTNVVATPDGTGAYRQASAVLRNIGRNESACVLSDTSAAGNTLMRQLIPRLTRDLYDIRPAVETELS